MMLSVEAYHDSQTNESNVSPAQREQREEKSRRSNTAHQPAKSGQNKPQTLAMQVHTRKEAKTTAIARWPRLRLTGRG